MNTDLFTRTPFVSDKTWDKIKAGAALAGLTLGTVAICAISTFACAYAQGFGYSKGNREARMGTPAPTGIRTDGDRDYSATPAGRSFRSSSIFDRDEAA